MNDDDLNELKSIRDHLTEWLRRNKENQASVPAVQAGLEFTQWTIDAFTNRPDEAQEIPRPNITASALAANEYLQSALPMLPEVKLLSVLKGTAMTTAGTADFYSYVARTRDIPTPAAQHYAAHYTAKYQQLQQVYGRTDEIRELLSNLKKSQTSDRFERALQAYAASKSGATPRTAAANEIRNLLYGVKGDLFEIARNQPKENMTWGKMAARLAKGGTNSHDHIQLLHQGQVYSSLIGRLPDILKEREGTSLTDLDDIWTQVLDHLYIVLNLVAVS